MQAIPVDRIARTLRGLLQASPARACLEIRSPPRRVLASDARVIAAGLAQGLREQPEPDLRRRSDPGRQRIVVGDKLQSRFKGFTLHESPPGFPRRVVERKAI